MVEVRLSQEYANNIKSKTNSLIMKALKETITYFVIFILGFIILAITLILIFPVTWNDVVTSPAFLLTYFIFGGVGSGIITGEISKDKY